MIVDLHSHYPMHVLVRRGLPGQTAVQRARRARANAEARFVNWVSRRFNFEGPNHTPGVTPEQLRAGNVGVALSVLHWPLDELLPHLRAQPKAEWFDHIIIQMDDVEDEVAQHEGLCIAKSMSAARIANGQGKIALIHCVEGGFSLGATPTQIQENVAKLRGRGVAYVTLAHLIFCGVATNAPALPFLSERGYRFFFHQRRDLGLTELGEAAVNAMYDHRILIDVTHMSDAARNHTFKLLDERDPGETVPVMATHGAYRFNTREYGLPVAGIQQIARRGGVVGVIVCSHLACGAKEPRPASFSETVDVICRHIDRIREVTGSYDHIAIGSDIDGYIKPALKGLGVSSGLGLLEQALIARYGQLVAGKICYGNARRVLEYWAP